MTRLRFLQYMAGAAGASFLPDHREAAAQPGSAPSPFPLQVDLRVPFAPSAFPGSGRSHLAYELYLTNFSADALTIQRIDVIDADAPSRAPVAVVEAEQLASVLQTAGTRSPSAAAAVVAPGGTAVAFMWVESTRPVPARLRHRVLTTDAAVEGASIGTTTVELPVLSPPLQGAGWWIYNGPGNGSSNHHRRGIFSVDGRMYNSRRLAIDWFLHRNGRSVSGDVHDTRSYYAYGQPVFAVSDARVVAARDGRPDNIPGPVETFRTAIPNSMDSVAGNFITLDLGGDRYAWYLHLKPGSVQVNSGDRVRRGQRLGDIGCSGDSNLPHLHFEVTTSPRLLAGEGLPYLIDRFAVWNDGAWEGRSRELPLDRMLVDFGTSGRG